MLERYLDDILNSRNGHPFVEPTPDTETLAAIAVALQAVSAKREEPAASTMPGRWRLQARAEGLRAGGLPRH